MWIPLKFRDKSKLSKCYWAAEIQANFEVNTLPEHLYNLKKHVKYSTGFYEI